MSEEIELPPGYFFRPKTTGFHVAAYVEIRRKTWYGSRRVALTTIVPDRYATPKAAIQCGKRWAFEEWQVRYRNRARRRSYNQAVRALRRKS